VTNFTCLERYEVEYGKCPLQVANTEQALRSVMIKLLTMNKRELSKLQRVTRNWVIKHHSLNAAGLKLKGLLLDV